MNAEAAKAERYAAMQLEYARQQALHAIAVEEAHLHQLEIVTARTAAYYENLAKQRYEYYADKVRHASKHSIVNGTVTFSLEKPAEAAGAYVGGPIGAVAFGFVGRMVGVGPSLSYVPETGHFYFGPVIVLAPTGAAGFSLSYTPVPASQDPDAIAGGKSFSIATQRNLFLGAVLTKSPGSGPPVLGYSVGSRSPIAFSASYSFALRRHGKK